MTYTDKIRSALADAGAAGLTVSDLARAVKHDANKVSALLAVLRKRGEAFLDGGRWVLGAGGIAPPSTPPSAPPSWGSGKPSVVEAPAEEPEPTDDQVGEAIERAASACRFWVYSDRCIGISDGDAVVELDARGLQQIIDFLAGVRPLLDAEVA